MKTFHLDIRVRLKEGILDPQAEAVTTALKRLDFKGIEKLRVEKIFSVDLKAESESQAVSMAREMANKLLANVVMENFEVEVRT